MINSKGKVRLTAALKPEVSDGSGYQLSAVSYQPEI